MKGKILLGAVAVLVSANASAYLPEEATNVITQKAAARGFLPNDPRVLATRTAVGTAILDLGVVAAGAATAPTWGSVLLGIAVTTGAAYAVDAGIKWLFKPSGKVEVTKSGGSPSGSGISGSFAWTGADGLSGVVWAADPNEVIAYALRANEAPGTTFKDCQTIENGKRYNCVKYDSNNNWMGGVDAYYRQMDVGTIDVATGCKGWFDGVCHAATQPGSSAPTSEELTANDWAVKMGTDMTPEEKSTPVTAKTIADIVDAAFKKAAAKPGYGGMPYQLADPVTQTDVQEARAANPTTHVSTLENLVAQVSQVSPLATPTGSSASTSTNANEGQPKSDIGSDPNIGQPKLDATPTGSQILAPITDLLPDFKNFVMPSHDAACPKPSFNLFNKTIVMDAHCNLFEGVRSVLYNVMSLVWLLTAMFIILAA
jgi:hypothetical protein